MNLKSCIFTKIADPELFVGAFWILKPNFGMIKTKIPESIRRINGFKMGSKMLRVKDRANELGVKDILAIVWKLITIYIAFLPIPKYLLPRAQNRIFYPQHFWTHLKPFIGRMLSGILFFSISKFGFNIQNASINSLGSAIFVKI